MRKSLTWIKMAILRMVVVCYLATIPFSVHAQPKFTDDLKIGANGHFGVVLPEYPFYNYVVQDYVHSLDLNVVKESSGKNVWEDLYNYPEHGVSLFISSLGNKDVFGTEMSLTYFFKVNMIYTKHFRLYNRMGFGLGYVNRKFDSQANYLNVAVGSHINIHFNCRLGATVVLTDKLESNIGLSFDHLSNANTSAANLGINYVTAFTGLNYVLGNRTEKVAVEREKHKASNYMEVILAFGGKKIREFSFESKYYPTASLSVEAHRSFFRGFHMGVGLDLFYDSAVRTVLTSEGKTYKDTYSWETGVHISQTIVYNRFSITIQEGLYVGLKNHVYDKLMYNRGIIKYRVTDHFTMRLTMKSHLHILDYPEIGFGYRFN